MAMFKDERNTCMWFFTKLILGASLGVYAAIYVNENNNIDCLLAFFGSLLATLLTVYDFEEKG